MREFPVTLVAPDGREYSCHHAVELNNLVNAGYVRKTVVTTAAPADTEPAGHGGAKPIKAASDSRQPARDPK